MKYVTAFTTLALLASGAYAADAPKPDPNDPSTQHPVTISVQEVRSLQNLADITGAGCTTHADTGGLARCFLVIQAAQIIDRLAGQLAPPPPKSPTGK